MDVLEIDKIISSGIVVNGKTYNYVYTSLVGTLILATDYPVGNSHLASYIISCNSIAELLELILPVVSNDQKNAITSIMLGMNDL